ncbi:DUF1173 family protein [uncultured Ruegeria sp.]|uniref:DUF1173 family protein n=1 Tax=uncultured Ruegeria sp. TaxID=259304 RepID=UPI00262D88AA|nr:DUF1173 family protein [uncultured Ruegeria sp.]
MTLHLGNIELNVESAEGQDALARAHRKRDRVDCRCRVPYPKMYVAAVNGRFIVKRMPETGHEHAPDCTSYLPPGELSGLAQVQGSAITESPEDGTTTIRLGFPLKKIGKPRAMPELTGQPATEVKQSPYKLTITSLLHYLWHEADLGKWYPAMNGKRFWGVVHSALERAAAGKVVKGQDLARILYVPEYFRVDHKDEIAARRNALFAHLRPGKGGPAPLGLLIAEYKTHEPTSLGAKFVFKHAPGCPFFADEDIARRFNTVFAERLHLSEFVEGSHPIMIASFSISKSRYPVLLEMGMMLVTSNWIPFEHTRDVDLITRLTDQKRAFQKSLRFNLKSDAPIASAVLLDTVDPVALYVAEDPDSAEAVAALVGTASESRYSSWLWTSHDPMPAFPSRTPNRKTGDNHEQR